MIRDFDFLKTKFFIATYQKKVAENLYDLLNKVNIKNLTDESFIVYENDCLTICIIHKKDKDNALTLNIFSTYSTLWFSDSSQYFDEEISINFITNFYHSILKGEFIIEDYFCSKRKILSIINFVELDVKEIVIPYSLFYKLYLKFFKSKIRSVKFMPPSFFD